MSNYCVLESILMPKELFENERYREMSCTAKVLYSLLLEKKMYAAMNDWIDDSGVSYVMYPKMQMMRDLGCTLYRLDQAMDELKKHDLISIIPVNGKPHQIYVPDVNGMKQQEAMEEAMKEMNQKMEHVTEMEELEEKMVAVEMKNWKGEKLFICPEENRDIFKGSSYMDDQGIIDLYVVEDDGIEVGEHLAFALAGVFEMDREFGESILKIFKESLENEEKEIAAIKMEAFLVMMDAEEWMVDSLKICARNLITWAVFAFAIFEEIDFYLDLFFKNAKK